MDTYRPSEENFTDVAKLLCAIDTVLCDEMALEDAVRQSHRVWTALDEEPWADGHHSGDCTKKPYTCMRCVIERHEAKAREMWDNES